MDFNLLSFQFTGHPEVFPGFFIRWYSLMFVLAFGLGIYILKRIYNKEGVPISELDRLVTPVVLATIIGARLGHVFFYDWASYKDNLIDIFKVWEGGLASHGGAIGIIIALIWYSKKSIQTYWWTIDRLVIVTSLAAMFIRFGNFFNHEILGKVAEDLPWGVQFMVNPFRPELGMTPPVHPAQLYEAFCYLIIFVVLMFLYFRTKAAKYQGFLLGVFLVFVFTARFFIEGLKDVQVEAEHVFIGNYGINYGQALSIPFVLGGITLILLSRSNYSEDGKKPVVSKED